MDKRTVEEVRAYRALLDHVTVRKQREEHRLIHQMLNEAGVPEDVAADGVRTCLTGRVAGLIARRTV